MALNQILQVIKLKYKYASCQREGELVFWGDVGDMTDYSGNKERVCRVIRLRMQLNPDCTIWGEKAG